MRGPVERADPQESARDFLARSPSARAEALLRRQSRPTESPDGPDEALEAATARLAADRDLDGCGDIMVARGGEVGAAGSDVGTGVEPSVGERVGPAAFAGPGRFWRGGLHAHSDRSDGALPPAEVADRYRNAGYDFVAVTDHFRAVHGYPVTDTRGLRRDGFTTLLGAELHAPGPELADEWHLVGDALHVACSPVERILLTGGAPGCQLGTGDGLTEATVPLGFLADATHLRVTVVTATGQRAWTNPRWRDPAADAPRAPAPPP